MSWRDPTWWAALLGVFVVVVAVVWGGRRHRTLLRELFTGDLFDRVLPRSVRVRRTVRDLLVIVGLTSIVVALVEPLYGKEVQQVESRGVDIAVVVDLSLSMDARDVSPSRLERAKREILDLMDMMEGDRLGLVIFAGGAFPRLPLTTDIDAIELVVDELSTDMFAAQGSSMGEGIRTAMKLLDGSDRPAGKAILLMTDGEVHDPADALAAAQEAADADVRVYGLVVGQESAPIPTQRGPLMNNGTTVMTTPDDSLLRDIARMTGGAFVTSVASNDDMTTLYRDEMRTRLVAATSGSMQRETWRTGYQWPLGVGLMCLLLASWLGDGKRRWGSAVAVVLAAQFALHGVAMAGELDDADALYRSGRYSEASDIFADMTSREPANVEAWQRLGASRYKLNDWDGAARAFDTATQIGGGVESQYNAGNAHYNAGRLVESLTRYQGVLEQGPHPGAEHNLAMLLNELEKRAQIQPPPPPQQENSEEPPEDEPEDGDTGEEGDGGDSDSESGEEDGDSGDDQDGEEPGDDGGGEGGEPGGEGEPNGEPGDPGENGEPSDPSDANSEGNPGDDDQELEDGDTNGTADLTEGDGSEGGEPTDGMAAGGGEGGGEASEDGGPVTRTQAERLLDGVEEGRPRIRIPGERTSKPW
jgi:Ca-activated chloride channel family protein